MAEQGIDVQIQVNADTGQLDVLNQKLKDTTDKAKETGQGFSGLSKEAEGLLKSFLPFATAGGIISFFTSAVKEAEASNEALRRLKFGLEAAGVSWDKNKQSVMEWSESIQAATRFDNTEALSSLERMVRVTGHLAQGQKAVQLAMNLSVASGRDLSSTLDLVTNLLNGNSRSLMEARREFGAFVGSAQTAQEALDRLDKTTRGSALQDGSFTKRAVELKAAWGDLAKEVGQGLIPALATVFDLLRGGLVWFEKMASAIATLGAALFVMVEKIPEALKAAFTFDKEGIKAAAKEAMASVLTVVEAGAEDLQRLGETRTADVLRQTEEETRLTARKSKEEVDQEAEKAKKILEIQEELQKKTLEFSRDTLEGKRALFEEEVDQLSQRIHREITDEAKKNATLNLLNQYRTAGFMALQREEEKSAKDKALKTRQIEDELDKQIAALGQRGFKQKHALLLAEFKMQRDKITAEITDEVDRARALDKLKILETKRSEELAKEEFRLKARLVSETITTSLEALQIVNAMGEHQSKEEARRAKALLALQKAIAIGWAFVEGAKHGPAGMALAAAQTAVIAAQFAQQSRAIDQAREASEKGKEEFKISTSLPGGGDLERIFSKEPALPGLSESALEFAAFTPPAGAPIAPTAEPAPSVSPGPAQDVPSAGPGGGGQQVVILVGGIAVNVYPNSLDLSDTRTALARLGDEVQRETLQAIQFALRVKNVQDKFVRLAS